MTKPDSIGLYETKLSKMEKCKIEGYEIVVSNLKKGKEGLLVAVREGTFESIERISEGNDQLITVRVVYPNITIRIIAVHGPQEDDSIENRELFYEAVAVELERCRTNEECPLVLGDFNAKICPDEKLETIDSYSGNGKLLKDLIESQNLKVANFHDKTLGKWTRIQDTKNGVVKSVLDYILVNEQYYRQISNMVIDEEQLFTPFRIVRKKGKNKITFTDHCAMTLEMICCKGQMESRRTNKQKVWNFTEEGLEKYSRLSNVIAPLPYSKTSTDRFQAWSKVVEGILPKCFKKKTCGKKPRNSKEEKWKARKEIRDIKRGKIQRQVVHEYKKRLHERNLRRLEEQTTKRIKDTVSKLTHKDKFSQSGYWKLKKSITKNRTQ